MTIRLTDDDLLVRDSVSRFVRKEYDPSVPTAPEGAFDTERWQALAEMGLLGLVADPDGGSLAEAVQQVAITFEEMGRSLAPEPLLPFAALAPAVLRALSDNPSARERLRAMGAGKWLSLLLCDGGSPMPVVTVTAKRDVNGYRLSGRAHRLLGGAVADSYLVPARLDGATVLFEIEADIVGTTRSDFRTIDGRQMSDVVLDHAPAAPDQLLSQSKDLDGVLVAAWNLTTVAICAEMVGVMFHALDVTRNYLGMRRQFGRPIGEFQALRHRLAEMFVEAQQARSMLMRGIVALQTPRFQDAERQIHAMKVRVNEAAKKVGAQAIQLHGGIGMTEEYVIGRSYKRLLVDSILLGETSARLKSFISTSMQRTSFAKAGIGAHLSLPEESQP